MFCLLHVFAMSKVKVIKTTQIGDNMESKVQGINKYWTKSWTDPKIKKDIPTRGDEETAELQKKGMGTNPETDWRPLEQLG